VDGRTVPPRPSTSRHQESGHCVDFTDSTVRMMIFINLTSFARPDFVRPSRIYDGEPGH
jgi:hypothetical protein